jgi:hypothetical protein
MRRLIVVVWFTLSAADPRSTMAAAPDSRTGEAVLLMMRFAERTGLSSSRAPRRYLWTDAFAVCNFLGLARVTGDERYRALALRLVDQVHHTLGRHRHDDPRRGWLSGLDDRQGEEHPTRGGLRIGKSLPERAPGERPDDLLEWDRDGQYFHYLGKWMHCLDQAARATGETRYNVWARELAATAYRAFTYRPPGGGSPRMHWKMSVDLSRALVPSMGQHDPLDGYVTCLQLQATAAAVPASPAEPDLSEAARAFAAMVDRGALASADPLGLGGLLSDAARLAQLMRAGAFEDETLLEDLLAAAAAGLRYYVRQPDLHQPADRRLAFRELGLAIGLHAPALIRETIELETAAIAADSTVRILLDALNEHRELGRRIESFWRDPANQRGQAWTEHRDINEVMLATSLAPEGFLVLSPPR